MAVSLILSDEDQADEGARLLFSYKLPKAKNKAEKVKGSDQPDDLVGTNGDDSIDGGNGNDEITGLYGNDILKGGNDDDRIAGDSGILTVDRQPGGDDWLDGGKGVDWLDGGDGDDVLKGGGDSDYMFGGNGGNDYLDGGKDADRMGGGFRSPGDDPRTPGVDADIVKGGSGNDVFEARFWYKESGWDGYGGAKLLGPHSDVVIDFKPGQDRVDLVFYSQDGRFTYHHGGFSLFDTNGDGVLDGNDQFVRIEEVAVNGKAKLSTVLEVGDASVAGGRFSAGLLEPGTHELTIWKQTGLTADDFVPDKSYLGIFGRSTGTSGDDWITAGDNGTRIDGGAGDDLLRGEGGADTFVFRYASGSPGADVIEDFIKGEDALDLGVSFDSLDTNRNGVLDGKDDAVRILDDHQLLAPGTAPTVADSTIIDLDVATGRASSFTGDNSVTIHGVTDLGPADFFGANAVS